jgi:hypothetical protein
MVSSNYNFLWNQVDLIYLFCLFFPCTLIIEKEYILSILCASTDLGNGDIKIKKQDEGRCGERV